MAMVEEFREFTARGNAVDLAVGVVVGAAFGKVVTSLVNDILMPPLGWITSGVNFDRLAWTLRPAENGEPAVALRYGAFATVMLDFLLVSIAVFAVVRVLNALRRKAA